MTLESAIKWLQRVDTRLQEVEKIGKSIVSLADIAELEKLIKTKTRELANVDAGLDKKRRSLRGEVNNLGKRVKELEEIQKEIVTVQSTATEKLPKKKSKFAQILDIFK